MKYITLIVEDILGNRITRDYKNDPEAAEEVWGERVVDMLDTLSKSIEEKF